MSHQKRRYKVEFDPKIMEDLLCQSRVTLVFPLKVKVLPDKIKPFWFALNKECHGLVDGQTKDTARIFYAPADYPNAYNFIFFSIFS